MLGGGCEEAALAAIRYFCACVSMCLCVRVPCASVRFWACLSCLCIYSRISVPVVVPVCGATR